MPQFPHFITEDPPTSYDSGISNNNDSQHVQWDDCYEDEDDGYRYSQYHQQMQEEKGRRQSKWQNEEMSSPLLVDKQNNIMASLYQQSLVHGGGV